ILKTRQCSKYKLQSRIAAWHQSGGTERGVGWRRFDVGGQATGRLVSGGFRDSRAEERLDERGGTRDAVAFDDFDRNVACFLHQIVISQDVAESEFGHARLARAEEFAGTAEAEITLGDVEAIARRFEDSQTLDRFGARFFVVNENAIRLSLAASDAAAKLVELRQPEAIGIDDHHDRSIRNVDADFDDRGADENVDRAALEAIHRL